MKMIARGSGTGSGSRSEAKSIAVPVCYLHASDVTRTQCQFPQTTSLLCAMFQHFTCLFMQRRTEAMFEIEPGCLDDNEVGAFVEGNVSDEQRPRLEAHIAQCAKCREIVVDVFRTLAFPDPTVTDLSSK
jgi:hypothetical protein